jgi:hypothetical protein
MKILFVVCGEGLGHASLHTPFKEVHAAIIGSKNGPDIIVAAANSRKL